MNETNKNEQTNNTQMQTYYFNENMRSKGILAISGAVVLSLLIIFLNGLFPVTFLFPVVFVIAFYGISQYSKGNTKVYRAKCPNCKFEFAFPLNSVGENCPKCQKRVVINGSKFENID